MTYSVNQFITQAAGGSGLNSWDSSNFTAVAGETLIAVLYGQSNYDPGAVTDVVGSNDAWTMIGTGLTSSIHRWRMYYLPNAVAGSCTLRVAWPNGVSFPKFNIVSVSGLAASPFNTFAQGTQASPGSGADAITSGLTGTLVRSPAMLLGFSWNYGASGDPPDIGTGFTDIGTDTNRSRFEHKRLTSISAAAATFTNSPNSAHATLAIVMTEVFTEIAADPFDTNGGTLGANWTDLDPGWTVSSQQATSSAAGTADSAKYTGATFPADQWAQCSIGTVVEATTDEGAGPAVRCASGVAGNMLFLQGNAVETRIYKRIGGTFTQLGSNGPPVTTGDVLYLEVVGNTIVAKKNGTAICGSPLDGSGGTGIPASGAAGIWGFSNGGGATLDLWSAGDFIDHGTSTGSSAVTAAGVTGTVTALLSQTAVPISDGTTNAWLSTGANMWSTIDEFPANDADYIYTETLGSRSRIKLTALADPNSSANHTLSFRIAGNGAAECTVYLYSGGTSAVGSGTLVKSYNYVAHTATLTDHVNTLAGANADLIDDYANLYLEFEAT